MYDLQALEQAVEADRKALAAVESRLEGDEALERARVLAEEGRRALASVQGQRRDLDLEVQGIAARIKEMDSKLYAGTTTSTKELMGFQQDIRSLERMKGEREDRLLQLMLGEDEGQDAMGLLEASLAEEETRWGVERDRLTGEAERLRSELAALRGREGETAAALTSQETAVYKGLKASRGAAVARVEQGSCGACGVSIPVQRLREARAAQALARCGNCGRVLYAG
jgi:predicted  nucleic acid-binding Zn-ribbon protein